MNAHQIDYTVYGDDMQAVEITLDNGETVIAEAGAMNWMEEGISYEARMGDGSRPDESLLNKLFNAGKRLISGESLFLTHFTNQAASRKRVTFASPYPGKIIPVDLIKNGGELLCQKDAFLCAALGVQLDIAFTKRFGAGLFGGEGFILERLSGNGLVFLHACGTVIERKLQNETLFIDTGCIVAFSPGLDYDIQVAGNLRSVLFGGEGIFLATLRGTGTVLLQTLPFSRLADRIIRQAPSLMGKGKEEGSILGGIGRFIDGR